MSVAVLPVRIRDYGPADLNDVAAVWQEGWNGTGLYPGQRPSLADYRERLSNEGRGWTTHVADQGARLVGFVAFQRDERWLRQLFVSPERQRAGVGTLLLDLVKKEMPGGFWLRTDKANDAARRFYETAGMILRDESRHPAGRHIVVNYFWPK